jgi:hypothetical protein
MHKTGGCGDDDSTEMDDASTRMLRQNTAVSIRQSSARIDKVLQDQEMMVSESATLGHPDCPIAFSNSVIRQAPGSTKIPRQYVGAYRSDLSYPWTTIQSIGGNEKKAALVLTPTFPSWTTLAQTPREAT